MSFPQFFRQCGPWAYGRIKAPVFLVFGVAALLWLASCGQIRPVPEGLDTGAYTPITYQDLLARGQIGLASGQKIKLPAYFWQFVTYDPAMVPNYLNLLRYPLTWPDLQWFAIYGTPDMQGYYDRVVMDDDQRRSYRLQRLDRIMIYGELANLGPGLLYLQVHHIDKLEEN